MQTIYSSILENNLQIGQRHNHPSTHNVREWTSTLFFRRLRIIISPKEILGQLSGKVKLLA
jgi:hypothetical protein